MNELAFLIFAGAIVAAFGPMFACRAICWTFFRSASRGETFHDCGWSDVLAFARLGLVCLAFRIRRQIFLATGRVRFVLCGYQLELRVLIAKLALKLRFRCPKASVFLKQISGFEPDASDDDTDAGFGGGTGGKCGLKFVDQGEDLHGPVRTKSCAKTGAKILFQIFRAAGNAPMPASSGDAFHNAAARKSFWFGGTEERGRCRWTLAASALFLHIFRAQEGAMRTRRGGSFRMFFQPSPGAKPGSCHGFAGRDETAGKSSCVLGLPKLHTMRLAALAFISVSAALLLSGCPAAKSAWQSYDRSVSRDIAIGASQDRGGYASYTVHLGPQSARRAPDFKPPVEAMKGVTW